MKKNKMSATLWFCIISTIVALICALKFDGTKEMIFWFCFWIFGICSLIGYSCENAVRMPDNFMDNKR